MYKPSIVYRMYRNKGIVKFFITFLECLENSSYNKKVIENVGGIPLSNDLGASVNVRLVSTIDYTAGETERIEMWLDGQIVEKNNVKYLRYTEEHESRTITTTIKLAGQQSFIMRKGAVNMRLPLNVTQRETGHYNSEAGSIPLWVDTHRLQYTYDNKSQFDVQYDLYVGGQQTGTYTLNLTFTEESS